MIHPLPSSVDGSSGSSLVSSSQAPLVAAKTAGVMSSPKYVSNVIKSSMIVFLHSCRPARWGIPKGPRHLLSHLELLLTSKTKVSLLSCLQACISMPLRILLRRAAACSGRKNISLRHTAIYHQGLLWLLTLDQCFHRYRGGRNRQCSGRFRVGGMRRYFRVSRQELFRIL